MPRHTPRTIWKPVQINALSISETGAPPVEVFSSIRAVSADASMGLSIKHLQLLLTMGIVEDTATDNSHIVGGIFGFFKWPEDAATPTSATIDLENRTKIFGRRQFLVQGTQPRLYTVNIKSVRLSLGEELYAFAQKLTERATTIEWNIEGRVSHYETQA